MRFNLLLLLLFVVAALIDAFEYGTYALIAIGVVLAFISLIVVAVYKYLIRDTFDDF